MFYLTWHILPHLPRAKSMHTVLIRFSADLYGTLVKLLASQVTFISFVLLPLRSSDSQQCSSLLDLSKIYSVFSGH